MAVTSREFFTKQLESMNSDRVSSKRIAAITKTAFDLRDNAPRVVDQAAQNPHLNETGKRVARQNALRDLFTDNARNRQELRRLRETASAELRSLTLPALDKTDIVAEMREAEMRAIVRAMPQEQRDRLSRLSPPLLAAVVRAPPELSGISPSVHAQLQNELIETAHPEKVAAIKAELEGLNLADLAVKDTEKALTEAADFAPGEDAPYLESITAQLEKPAEPDNRPDPNDLDAMIVQHRRKHRIPAA